MTYEQIRSKLKGLFPSLPIRLVDGAIFLGDNERADAIHTETATGNPQGEIDRLARIIRERLSSGWTPAPKPPGAL